MLTGHLGHFFSDGMGNEIYDVKRGDTVDLPEDVGNRYVADGRASKKHVKAALEDLPPAFEPSQESEAMREKLAPGDLEHLRAIQAASGQKPTAVVGGIYPRGPVEGWIR